MTKKEFIEKLHEKGLYKSKAACERGLNDILSTVGDALVSEGEVNFIGWGKFEVREMSARDGINPSTGKTIKIAAKKVAKFKAGKNLNEVMN